MKPDPHDIDVEKSKTREIIERAEEADEDTEDLLADLLMLRARRRPDNSVNQRYEVVNARAIARIRQDGPRFFLDTQGNKIYAYLQEPDNLEVDVEEFVRLHEAGEMPDIDLDKVLPRQPNREALRRAMSTRSKTLKRPDGKADVKIPKRIVAKTMRLVPGTPRVMFTTGEDRVSDE